MGKHEGERTPGQISDSVSGDIDLTDIAYVQLGSNSGPPQSRNGRGMLKHWHPPKNETTPDHRTKKS